jgi:hypothetical protein
MCTDDHLLLAGQLQATDGQLHGTTDLTGATSVSFTGLAAVFSVKSASEIARPSNRRNHRHTFEKCPSVCCRDGVPGSICAEILLSVPGGVHQCALRVEPGDYRNAQFAYLQVVETSHSTRPSSQNIISSAIIIRLI